MNLKNIYDELKGDYEGVFSRLHDEEKIKKYLLKFMDNRMDVTIKDALAAADYETAFREAHNLKGVCANLSLDALGKSASELTEALRERNLKGDITPLVDAMQSDYDMTINALSKLKE